jgi:ketosteroid isomerase-like protein
MMIWGAGMTVNVGINAMKAFYLSAILLVAGSPTLAACPSVEKAMSEVPQVMRDMYAAAQTDDLKAFHAVTTTDFYSYDAAKRFDGDALMVLIKAAHDKGNVYEWTVTEPHVEVRCDMAYVSYVNVGSVTDATGKRAVTWLESAVLFHDKTRWRIRFFHSTRVPAQ